MFVVVLRGAAPLVHPGMIEVGQELPLGDEQCAQSLGPGTRPDLHAGRCLGVVQRSRSNVCIDHRVRWEHDLQASTAMDLDRQQHSPDLRQQGVESGGRATPRVSRVPEHFEKGRSVHRGGAVRGQVGDEQAAPAARKAALN